MKRAIIITLLAGLVVVACTNQSNDGAATVTEQYINALAAKDKAQITALSCPEWEESANLEVDALLSVEAAVDDLSCSVTGTESESTLVKCTGSLDLTYNDEIRAIDLSLRTYYLREDNGQWKVCEYK